MTLIMLPAATAQPKVLMLAQLPPPVHGAAVMNECIIRSEILQNNFEVDLIELRFAKSIEDLRKVSINKLFKVFKIYSNYFYKLMMNQYDFVYITASPIGNSFLRDSIFILLAKLFKIKPVVHFHGKGVLKECNKNKVKERVYNVTLSNCTVILLSQMLNYDLDKIKNLKDVHFLANGSKDLLDQKVKKVENQILYLSNVKQSKGIFDALKSVALLRDKGLIFKFVVAGQWGSRKEELEFYNYVQSNHLESIVEYVGPVYNQDKIETLNASSIFLFPTHEDCFPVVLLEAMSAGVPIVTTHEGAIPSIVVNGVTGRVVNKGDIHGIVESLEELMLNEELSLNYSKNARERYEQEYTLNVFERKLSDLWQGYAKGIDS